MSEDVRDGGAPNGDDAGDSELAGAPALPVAADRVDGTQSLPANAQSSLAIGSGQLSPLSIQAASLVRSIDSLSRIFWVSLAGTFLTLLFAGLSQLEGTIAADYVLLGEYQIPKAILPLLGVVFALFLLWLTANRLRTLALVLESSQLPPDAVEEIFLLNPPVLHVFDQSNLRRWSLFSGIGVFICIWGVYFGNSVALTLNAALQRGATFAEFDVPALGSYLLLIAAVIAYGVYSVFGPMKHIISRMYAVDFEIGWPRLGLGVFVIALVLVANNSNQFLDLGETQNDSIGPGIANAVDGETLFMQGVEIQLFGIDAMEPEQICRDATGADYSCGRAATQALQEVVHNTDVLCFSMFAVSTHKVVGVCKIHQPGDPVPEDDDAWFDAYRGDNLNRYMVESGHALGIGRGADRFDEEQNQAQVLRVGIWQGAFEPPVTWRVRHPR